MSIFIRDIHQNSGADTNSNYVGRTQQDNISLNNALTNPDFYLSRNVVRGSFNQQPFILESGWNMITFPNPYPLSIFDTFRLMYPELTDKTDNYISFFASSLGIGMVKDNSGNFWWPTNRFNGMKPIKSTIGYQVKVNNPDPRINFIPNIADYYNFNSGEKYYSAMASETIEITTNWNMFGYNRLSKAPTNEQLYKFFFPNGSNVYLHDSKGLPIATKSSPNNLVASDTLIFQRLKSFINIIKDNTGNFWSLYFGQIKPGTALDPLRSGQGYQIRINSGGDARGELSFPFYGKFPQDVIDSSPLIDGGNR